MLFRELEFSLTDIGAILDSPEFDRDKALDQQIELLELRRERIGNLIDMAKAMRGGGESALEFGPFDTSKLDEYAEQAKASWGKTPQWKEYEEKWAGRSKGEQVAMGRSTRSWRGWARHMAAAATSRGTSTRRPVPVPPSLPLPRCARTATERRLREAHPSTPSCHVPTGC